MADETLVNNKPAAELDERGLPDLPFLILTVMLVIIGLIMLFSASYPRAYADTGKSAFFFVRQGGFAAAGLVAMWFISRLNYQIWRALSFPILAVSIFLLILVPIFGVKVNDARRWLNLGFTQFQPSEIAKIGVVLTFAALMSSWKDRMKNPRYGIYPFLPVLGVVAFLLYLEPHLSATLIIVLTGGIMMYLGGTEKKWLLLLGLLGAGLVGIYLATKGYSSARIASWLHPEDYPQTGGYQVIQSRYAIGSGGLTGLGLGKSRQKYLYLPEEHNDYIFSIVCEELGLIGAALILILFLLLILRGYWLSMHARDRFGSLVVAGLVTLLGLQVFLNVGVVSNLLPSTGISLPFFSYGGTALMVNLAQMGIILGVSRQNTNHMVMKRKAKKSRESGGQRA